MIGHIVQKVWVLLVLFSMLLAGCAGNAPKVAARNGALTYSVEWPDRTRAMPYSAESALVRVTYNNETVGTWTCNRPSGDAAANEVYTFQGLPAASVQVEVEAYTQPNVAGDLIARGTSVVALRPNQPVTETAAISTTATSLSISAESLSTLERSTLPVVLTARDAADRVVPLRQGANQEPVEWATSNNEVFTIEEPLADGATISAITPGTATVSAQFGNLTANQELTVSARPRSSFVFEMPWNLYGHDLPETWRTVEVNAVDMLGRTVTQTIDRTGENAVSLEDVVIGSVSVTYAVKNAEGETLQTKSGTANVLDEGLTTLSITSDIFEPIPVWLQVTSDTGADRILIFWRDSSRYDATLNISATMSNGTTEDVASLVTWSMNYPEYLNISAEGVASAAYSGIYRKIVTTYATVGGVTSSAFFVFIR